MMRQINWSSSTEPFIGHAILAKPISFFEEKRGITFTDANDGLDYYRGALFLKDGLTPVALKQYRGANQEWTTIYLSPDCQDLNYITGMIASVVADLELDSTDIVWQRKDNPEA